MNAGTALTLVLLWLTVGSIVGVALTRAGHPLSTVATALPCWPLLLTLVRAGPPQNGGASRIHTAVDRLTKALVAAGADVPVALMEIREALLRADARVARMDALLVEEQGEPGIGTVQPIRDRCAADVDAVLVELARLRVQVGLAALAADTEPVRERLAELAARVGSLEEVAAVRRPG